MWDAWDDEGLAEAHDDSTSSTDGTREEDEAEERLLMRLGMSEYYGSEGFDHPPCASDVYVLVRRRLFRPAMTGLGRECLGPGREPLSPWGLCLCVLA